MSGRVRPHGRGEIRSAALHSEASSATSPSSDQELDEEGVE
ncbi:hypothetical protein [Nannocystis exedens]|nr:hypothetical protein [Nannocystis exedens]